MNSIKLIKPASSKQARVSQERKFLPKARCVYRQAAGGCCHTFCPLMDSPDLKQDLITGQAAVLRIYTAQWCQ